MTTSNNFFYHTNINNETETGFISLEGIYDSSAHIIMYDGESVSYRLAGQTNYGISKERNKISFIGSCTISLFSKSNP
jgi:hypothetical protein